MEKILQPLTQAFQAALNAAFGSRYASLDPQIRISANPKFGDFQANLAMGLAKELGRPPREVAQAVVAGLDLGDLADKVEIAGPGFINVRLSRQALESAATDLARDPGLGLGQASHRETVVVDYSSPNVAKEMHVGHLRSTIIGDAIVRILDSKGYRIIRQNHLGDWGTQFGMLIEYIHDLGWDRKADFDIQDLNQLYRDAKAKFDTDQEFALRSRNRVVALQSGDSDSVRLWQSLIQESKQHFAKVYQDLGVLLEEADYCGESFYNTMVGTIIQRLADQGLAVESQGAICAFPQGFPGPDGTPSPLILRKSDGGYGYDSTDMAALIYRVESLKATRLIYVTDFRQRQHIAMIFQAAREAGWLDQGIRAEHVYFGMVLGDDGKPFKSRSGDNILLADLLSEAVARALAIVQAKNPEMDATSQAAIARTIGIGAVKYADLSNDMVKDYVFNWDRMMAFDGNTAPYLQNAVVRIRGIFRKVREEGLDVAPEILAAADRAPGTATGPLLLVEENERALAFKVLQFSQVVDSVVQSLEPHRLCTWLYELATAYHSFYETCPVLKGTDTVTRDSRLLLSALVARVLSRGLDLLGIGVVERM